ncbi:MAG: Fimbrial protein pilin [Acidobacteriales bacterium]|nr:Fimbrial protein pilin [Terriglobales bacterium]
MKKQELCLLFLLISVSISAQEASDAIKNERSAVGAMRTLNTAETFYSNQYKDAGFACDITRLGLGSEKDKPKAEQKFNSENAGLIDESLAKGHDNRNGYRYDVSCPGVSKPQNTVQISAVPLEVGKSGRRAFCTELNSDAGKTSGGIIWYADDGTAATCWKNKQGIQ